MNSTSYTELHRIIYAAINPDEAVRYEDEWSEGYEPREGDYPSAVEADRVITALVSGGWISAAVQDA